MKIYWSGNRKNIIGLQVKKMRLERGLTQNGLAKKLQLMGLESTDLTILRIENGTRFVPDYEVKALMQALNVSYDELFLHQDI